MGMRRTITATAISAAILLAVSCAKERGTSTNEDARRYFEAWVAVQSKAHPEYMWEKAGSGIYILEDSQVENGEVVTDKAYVMVEYTCTDLDGNVIGTSHEDLSHKTGINYDKSYSYDEDDQSATQDEPTQSVSSKVDVASKDKKTPSQTSPRLKHSEAADVTSEILAKVKAGYSPEQETEDAPSLLSHSHQKGKKQKEKQKSLDIWDDVPSPERSKASGILADSVDKDSPKKAFNPDSGIWDDSDTKSIKKKQSSDIWADDSISKEKKEESNIWAEEPPSKQEAKNSAIWADSSESGPRGRRKREQSSDLWAPERPKTARRKRQNDSDIWADEGDDKPKENKSSIWADEDDDQQAKKKEKPVSQQSSIWADDGDDKPKGKQSDIRTYSGMCTVIT